MYSAGTNILCPKFNSFFANDFKSRPSDQLISGGYTIYSDYGYNFGGLGSDMFYSGGWTPSAKVTQLKKPTATIVLSDVYNILSPTVALGCSDLQYWFASSGGSVDLRHSGAVNLLWADGHAVPAKSTIVSTAGPYSTTRNPYMGDIFFITSFNDCYFGLHK